jgi:hypothetical protein
MKKIFIVVRITPDSDYNVGARVDCLGAFSKKKAAQTWLDANQEKYKENWCEFNIESVKIIEEGES